MGAIEKQEQAIVTPIDADAVLEMIKVFEYFKSKVLNSRDFATIQGKPFVKKSGWSKYALACNVSTERRDETVEERNGNRIYHFVYRAVHLPTGRYADAVGSASEAEKTQWNHPEHDVRTLAQTRAFNRSISNLVGGGEVSAEEMDPPRRRQPKRESQPREVRREPEKQTQLKLGTVNANVIAYNLKAIGIREENVSVTEEDDGFYITPSKGFAGDDYNRVNETLASMGAEWLDDSQHWVIWKEVDK